MNISEIYRGAQKSQRDSASSLRRDLLVLLAQAHPTEGFCLLLEKGLARTIGAGPSNILAGILHFHRGYRFPSLNATSKHTWITQAYVMDAFFWSFLVFVATSKHVRVT